ncbi:RHS repeat-associated core domain-containing protein [Dactylosporangium sp. McL0621]|uniref:RHS repeat-associated core domain-containing protein n=1 Tax=Dactylosporangium sp. McL0621 TaxID=3415678 RepID=UPI003CF1D7B0
MQTYNTASNRTAATTYAATAGGACQTSTPASATNWTYDTASRVNATGYAYDSLGRTSTVPGADTTVAGGGATTLTYHANDMLRTIAQDTRTSTYTLDVLPNRFATLADSDGTSTLTQVQHYGDDSDSPAWTVGDGAVLRTVKGLGRVVGIYTTATGMTWQIANLQGDLVGGVASTGFGLTFAGDFTEQGQPHSPSDTGRPYGWLGADQRWSNNPGGMVLMGARVYSPGAGRFLSTDPVYGGNANPYDYCRGDAVNCEDTNGQSPCRRMWSSNPWWGRYAQIGIRCSFSDWAVWAVISASPHSAASPGRSRRSSLRVSWGYRVRGLRRRRRDLRRDRRRGHIHLLVLLQEERRARCRCRGVDRQAQTPGARPVLVHTLPVMDRRR